MSGWNTPEKIETNRRNVERKTLYRWVSAMLGIASGVLTLHATNYAYFLLHPLLYIGGSLMTIGGTLVLLQKSRLGGVLVSAGALTGGFLGLPVILCKIKPELATAPVVPVGFILPVTSTILAFLSAESKHSI
ncbi:MAG: hypothetical protein QXQ64_09255 [Candidatus Bathyarchaeia archaeon]